VSNSQLTYEKLDVYQCALRFLAVTAQVSDKLPKGNSSILDQLKRASLSIVLNIAEGCGKPTPKENSRFFSIARGSAMECGAILDACKVLELAETEILGEGKNLIVRRAVVLQASIFATQSLA